MSRLPLAPCPVTYGHLAHDWRSAVGVGPSWSRCPGIKIPAEARYQPQTTRHHALAELRSTIGALRLKVTRWNATGVEYDGMRLIPRAVEDFPENSPDAWSALARTCLDSAKDLQALATYATRRYEETMKRSRAK